MTILVQKYGGTSVGDAERIRRVAERVVASASGDARVCVVVSAMGHTTDELLDLAAQVSSLPHPRELDMLLTAGERISIALLAMAIGDLGRDAISFTGSQAGIVTDQAHGKARIVAVGADRVREALEAGRIAIVAGFQGVSADSKDVTTLGRGGSDTTAVALAAALGADACEIYTDVDGVYTADPRIVPGARKLDVSRTRRCSSSRARGAQGADGRARRVRSQPRRALHVRTSFGDGEGTGGAGGRAAGEADHLRDRARHDRGEGRRSSASPTARGSRRASSVRSRTPGINIDMIVQNVSAEGHTDISFTLPKADLAHAEPVLPRLAEAVEASGSRSTRTSPRSRSSARA